MLKSQVTSPGFEESVEFQGDVKIDVSTEVYTQPLALVAAEAVFVRSRMPLSIRAPQSEPDRVTAQSLVPIVPLVVKVAPWLVLKLSEKTVVVVWAAAMPEKQQATNAAIWQRPVVFTRDGPNRISAIPVKMPSFRTINAIRRENTLQRIACQRVCEKSASRRLATTAFLP